MSVKVTPYLAVKNTPAAIAFYQQAFGATEESRITDPDGRVGHAEIRIQGTPIMISDEYPEINVLSPETLGGSPVMILLEVDDCDAVFSQAVAAGGRVDRPLQDAFDGKMRNGKLIDPFGHRWMILSWK
jgi:PhnB protein